MENGRDWYIALEGNIGVGKTTLAKRLAEDWGAALTLEQFEDNSFLPRFYQEPERYAFPLEMSFLAARYNQLKNNMVQADMFNPMYVADYCLFKSLVFARITLNEDEYSLYLRLFDIIDLQVRKPDLVVYLHRPLDKLLQNIKKRGRSYEMNIDQAYLEKIQDGYMEHFKTLPQQAVLILELEALDFEHNEKIYGAVRQLIQRYYSPGIHKIRV